MTSFTKDKINSDLTDEKALRTLIMASVRTSKRLNIKCGREDVPQSS